MGFLGYIPPLCFLNYVLFVIIFNYYGVKEMRKEDTEEEQTGRQKVRDQSISSPLACCSLNYLVCDLFVSQRLF